MFQAFIERVGASDHGEALAVGATYQVDGRLTEQLALQVPQSGSGRCQSRSAPGSLTFHGVTLLIFSPFLSGAAGSATW